MISTYKDEYRPPAQIVKSKVIRRNPLIKLSLTSKWQPLSCGALKERACQFPKAHTESSVCKQKPPVLIIPVDVSNDKEKDCIEAMLKNVQNKQPSQKIQLPRLVKKGVPDSRCAKPIRVNQLKGVDHRVDDSHVNERHLKQLMDKIDREIPSADDFLDSQTMWYPVYSERVRTKKVQQAIRWDSIFFQQVRLPPRNCYIIHPEFASEDLGKKNNLQSPVHSLL
ncbi:uncharacterized protein LOC122813409 [Protopterus annectens]|uniref:uncharacterized protein LOC122813409 n=1 Tax=Protopterus annectens TaxID=7888 RepID=UPI001CFB7516|nr:uncharacterized protein LOC122813409 [Protopterus annectens]